ncbi:MAG: pirin family protein [Phycisphaerales bacterium]|nr:pirin family protein [Phycisphaerales bacterium]
MIAIRPSSTRGHVDHGWLFARHTFSFARYYDPKHMSFRSLRVINEDTVAPGRGFGEHPHDNMEIITYVLSGTLAHRDSLGHEQLLRPGEVQRMTAGTGITHAEYNASKTEPVHLIQIWITPTERNTAPSYEQKPFTPPAAPASLQLVASPSGDSGSVRIGQDARISIARLQPGKSLSIDLAQSRHAYIQVARGQVAINNQPLSQGDGAAISDERTFTLSAPTDASEPAELLVFDLS